MPLADLGCILPRMSANIIAGRFPKYGALPNVYGSPGNFNADLTIVSSMNMALHVGATDWARGVLENFLTHGMRWVLPTQVQLVA